MKTLRFLIATCLLCLTVTQAKAVVVFSTMGGYSDAGFTTAANSFAQGDTAYFRVTVTAVPSPAEAEIYLENISFTGIQIDDGSTTMLLSSGVTTGEGALRTLAFTNFSGSALLTTTVDFSYVIDTALDTSAGYGVTAFLDVSGIAWTLLVNGFAVVPFLQTTVSGTSISVEQAKVSAPGGAGLMFAGLIVAGAIRRKARVQAQA
jgi:hypothetical protein